MRDEFYSQKMAKLLFVYKMFKRTGKVGVKAYAERCWGEGGCLGRIGGGTNFAKSTKVTKIITKAVV
jgi:hypothetical protein